MSGGCILCHGIRFKPKEINLAQKLDCRLGDEDEGAESGDRIIYK